MLRWDGGYDLDSVGRAVITAAEATNCADKHPNLCPNYAASGECLNNPGWMVINCARSCNACHLLDPGLRCDRGRLNISTTPFLVPGDLGGIFSAVSPGKCPLVAWNISEARRGTGDSAHADSPVP